MCVCVIYCCCSKWEAATLFGSKECFPCLSPSACALAAPVRVQDAFCHCACTWSSCWHPRDYNRALLFLSPFFLVTILNHLFFFLTVDSSPRHSSRISAPPSIKSWTGLLAGKSWSSILVLCTWGKASLLSCCWSNTCSFHVLPHSPLCL